MANTDSSRYRMIDVWRGIACLMVVLDHSGIVIRHYGVAASGPIEHQIRRGIEFLLTMALGPTMFFVLSGFCVGATLESCRRKETGAGVFLLRRFWRIFPTYWAALAAMVLMVFALDYLGLSRFRENALALALDSPLELSPAQWFGNITLTETWRPRYAGSYLDESAIFTRVAWTLCYQEQFYAISALILAFARPRLFPALVTVSLTLFGYRLFLWDSGGMKSIEGLFPMYWQHFAAGLAVYYRLQTGASARTRRGIDLALLGMLGISILAMDTESAVAAGFALALIGLKPFDDRIAAKSPARLLQWVGMRSYSIFLIHVPVLTVTHQLLNEVCGVDAYWHRFWVILPVALVASVGVGCVFHDLIEKRFLSHPAGLQGRTLLGCLLKPRRSTGLAS